MMIDPPLILAAADAASSGGFVDMFLRWARMESNWQIALVLFGVTAQLIFFGRWIVQWIASERRGESHMPEIFWWLSLIGAGMLLLYFTLRREPVGVLGQSIGWLVYLRNLHLIRRAKRAARADDDE